MKEEKAPGKREEGGREDKEGPSSTLSLSPRVQHEKHHHAGHNVCKTDLSKAILHLSIENSVIMSKEPSSDLESAMQMLIQTFHKYSGKEGDKFTLSRAELKELLVEELGSYLGNSKENEAIEKVMNDLDANNDGEVDFTEFIILMGALTVACNDFFLEKTDDKPKDGGKSEAGKTD
ncbi:S100-A1-like isoform X1 [Solea senegalensis]|uniref:S100-A1-like isoform X1 n=2 Tax=Solea senegalensis TaxID=28829 RepID=A0AAV6R8A8_SOLSE|nr:S100-A1-like isoform X1 [Solea senegalensis]